MAPVTRLKRSAFAGILFLAAACGGGENPKPAPVTPPVVEEEVENVAPSITKVVIEGVPAAGRKLSAVVSGWKDPEGAEATYRYAWFADGKAIAGQTNADLSGKYFSKGDSITVAVTPFDGKLAGEAVASAPLVIRNTPPSFASVTLGAGPFRTNEPLTMNASGFADADGDPAGFTYRWTKNGTLIAGQTAVTLAGTHFEKGDLIVGEATPFDGEESGAPLSSAGAAIGNSPPTLTSATFTSVGATPYGAEATFYVDGWTGLADADATDTLSVRYQWKAGGIALFGRTGRVLPTGAHSIKGVSISVDVIAFDGADEGTVYTVPAQTIVNTPPTIGAVSFGAGPFYKGSTLTATALGVDDADTLDFLTTEYLWFVNGVSGATTQVINSGFAQGATVTVAARVWDGTAFTAWVMAAPETIQNRLPVIQTLTLGASPQPATEASTLSFTATSSDADGDPITYEPVWVVNGTPTNVTAETLTGAHFAKGDPVTLRLRAHDGFALGNTVTSNAVTIANAAPGQPGILLNPAVAVEAAPLYVSLLTASTDADPADSVSYTYVWSRDGVTQPSASDTTAVSSAAVTAGQTWKVVVTPSDSFAAGATAWAESTVEFDEWAATTLNEDTAFWRNYHTAVWTGRHMIVWGGTDGEGVTGSFLTHGGRYDPVTHAWTVMTETDNKPAPRAAHSAVWTGREMIVWGGWDASLSAGSYLKTGARYDPSLGVWTTMSDTGAPAERQYHTAIWTGRAMLVWGGKNAAYLNDGASYDPQQNAWSPLAATTAAGRAFHTATWTGSHMLIWGGADGASALAAGGRYDPATDTWAAIATSGAPAARSKHSAVWTGEEMLVWGGSAGASYFQTGGRYDPAGNTWSSISTTNAPPARDSHTAVWSGNDMIVWGGSNGSANVATGARYDPRANAWTATSLAATPSARKRHTAVWTGRAMIVWGGTTTGGSLQSGGVFVPRARTETWFATADAPATRLLHTAVWTGSEMITWGGEVGIAQDVYLQTGERYNPTTNSWTATNTASAPAARSFHTAVWTGREMIVWGGVGIDGGPTDWNTGGRYSPSSNAWTATEVYRDAEQSSQLDGRSRHTAVWTGSQMIIFGGHNTEGLYLYYPEANTWSIGSTTNMPGPRYNAAAVWTGREMIAWGGFNLLNNSLLDTGGRYDPQTNSWAATPATDSPAARYLHTAIWTGREMVIWGGEEVYGSSEPSLTGARYRPDTNTWAAVATVTAPAIGLFHSAVWTGREMIVWGGFRPNEVNLELNGLDVGGRYDPTTDTWTAVSTNGAPAARGKHTAVWTGWEMLISGGRALNNSGDTGTLGSAGGYVPPNP